MEYSFQFIYVQCMKSLNYCTISTIYKTRFAFCPASKARKNVHMLFLSCNLHL